MILMMSKILFDSYKQVSVKFEFVEHLKLSVYLIEIKKRQLLDAFFY